MKNDGVGGD